MHRMPGIIFVCNNRTLESTKFSFAFFFLISVVCKIIKIELSMRPRPKSYFRNGEIWNDKLFAKITGKNVRSHFSLNFCFISKLSHQIHSDLLTIYIFSWIRQNFLVLFKIFEKIWTKNCEKNMTSSAWDDVQNKKMLKGFENFTIFSSLESRIIRASFFYPTKLPFV